MHKKGTRQAQIAQNMMSRLKNLSRPFGKQSKTYEMRVLSYGVSCGVYVCVFVCPMPCGTVLFDVKYTSAGGATDSTYLQVCAVPERTDRCVALIYALYTPACLYVVVLLLFCVRLRKIVGSK